MIFSFFLSSFLGFSFMRRIWFRRIGMYYTAGTFIIIDCIYCKLSSIDSDWKYQIDKNSEYTTMDLYVGRPRGDKYMLVYAKYGLDK